MFLKFAWLEVAYCLVGHFTLLLWVSVVVRRVLLDGSKLPGLGADLLAWWIALSAAGILLVLFFCYSLFCSLAPIFMIAGRYTLAERIYKRTLKMRQKALLRETGREDEAMHQASQLDGSANYMRIKYAFVCVVVLVLGILFSLWLDGAL